MTIASSLYGGNDIPLGDKLRFGTNTALAATDTTLLNLSSGNAGIVHGILIDAEYSSGSGTQIVDDIKVTVDGAAERTYTGTFAKIKFASSGTATNNYAAEGLFIPLPIRHADSMVVKASVSSTSGGTVSAQVIYSVE